jgi:heme/copper-type cytochrome/quinol oxidase subunit 1
MNLGQRIIVSISFGLALAVVGSYILNRESTGWFGYAPLTNAIYEPGPSPVVRMVVWLGLIAVWALVSLVLMRSPRARGGGR